MNATIDWRKHRSNFVGKNGSVFIVRCPACDLENYAPAVASGTCAWCGWTANASTGTRPNEGQECQRN